MHTAVFKVDNQPFLQHRELCSVSYSNLNGKRIAKRIDICICITEQLCCTLETITTLLINYTPSEIKVYFFKDSNISNIFCRVNGHILLITTLPDSLLCLFIYQYTHLFAKEYLLYKMWITFHKKFYTFCYKNVITLFIWVDSWPYLLPDLTQKYLG